MPSSATVPMSRSRHERIRNCGLPAFAPSTTGHGNWYEESNGRFSMLLPLPCQTPEEAVAELLRVTEFGLPTRVIFDWVGAPEPVLYQMWEPVWAAAAETGLPINLHANPRGGLRQIGVGVSGLEPRNQSLMTVATSVRPAIPRRVAPQQSPLPLRRPRQCPSAAQSGHLRSRQAVRPILSTSCLAGAGGFEPPYGGIKIRCLTTWLRPNRLQNNAPRPIPEGICLTGLCAHTLRVGATPEKDKSMWPVIPALAILMAQAPQPSAPSKSSEWCFEVGKGSTLCKDTEAACAELRRTNAATATSACKRVEPHEIQTSPTEPPAPPSPAKQTPTQR